MNVIFNFSVFIIGLVQLDDKRYKLVTLWKHYIKVEYALAWLQSLVSL